jgi:hypothetical protein
MTLARRAPREVYRIYDEEEFLAEDWVECLHAAPPQRAQGGEERRSGRLAGVAMLCAATGVFGGVIVVSRLSSAKSSRRTLDRAVRATATALIGPARVTRTRVWQARALAGGPSHEPQPRSHRLEADSRRRPGEARHESPGSPRHPVAVAVADAQAPTATQLARAESPPLARASSAGRSSAPAEFGFER